MSAIAVTMHHRIDDPGHIRGVRTVALLEFTKGHWLTMYRGRFPSDAPPIEMRVMTRDRPEAVQLSDDVPSYRTHSGKLMWKLLSARIAMLLGR